MTLIPISAVSPAPDGSFAPARGVFKFTPTARRVLNDVAVLPVPFQVPLTLGMAEVDLAPNDLTWVWRIDEHVSGSPARTIYANVPDAVSIPYTDLVPIDPGTLAPTAEPVTAAWTAALGDLQTELQASISAGTLTPDPDDPGFFLIGAQ